MLNSILSLISLFLFGAPTLIANIISVSVIYTGGAGERFLINNWIILCKENNYLPDKAITHWNKTFWAVVCLLDIATQVRSWLNQSKVFFFFSHGGYCAAGSSATHTILEDFQFSIRKGGGNFLVPFSSQQHVSHSNPTWNFNFIRGKVS